MSGGEALLFWVLAPAAVLGALGLLFARKAVHAAVSMALVMVSMGIFYIAQDAEFVGIIQIFVYSGAVMMLFLFVIMLIGVDASDSMIETIPGHRVLSYLLGLAYLALAALGISRVALPSEPGDLAAAQSEGSVTALARELFESQVLPFEVLGSLLVIAVMGAMVLAHQERFGEPVTQREHAIRKIRSGQFLAGKPNPGVYARHNAADTPALLPDGTPVAVSVPRVLVARDQVERPDKYELPTEDAAAAVGEQEDHSEVEEGSQR